MRRFFKVLIENDGDLKEKWIEHYESDEPIKFNDVIVSLLDTTDWFCIGTTCNFCESLKKEIKQ